MHGKGGKIITQLWHTGRISHTSLQSDGIAPVLVSDSCAKARTFVRGETDEGAFVEVSQPRALKVEELSGIIADDGKAARAAVDSARFDGVKIHVVEGSFNR